MARSPGSGVDLGRGVEMAVGALNGLVGDYLHRTGNGLATEMEVVRWILPAPHVESDPSKDDAATSSGVETSTSAATPEIAMTADSGATPEIAPTPDVAPQAAPQLSFVAQDGRLSLTKEGLSAAFSRAPRRIAVFVHGLMSTEDIWRGTPGPSYGERLASDLGIASIEVRYNSGLRISQNGELLDALLERFVAAYPGPIDEIIMIGHSMGGLVIRSAHHAASERDRAWLPVCRRAFYLGSPHLGAPLERVGNALTWALKKIPNPVTGLIAEIVNLRSVGVKDLRYGNLRREDWEGADADALLTNRRHPVPLLPHVRHHLIVGSLSRDLESSVLFGDLLVPVRSASGRAVHSDRSPVFPQEHVALLPGYHHLRLAHDPEVYTRLRAWAEEPLS